jgi:hypothetical protein
MEAKMHTPRTGTSRTLLAQATQRAHEELTRRLAELHQLAPLLERLEPVLPALAAQGLEVYPSDIGHTWHRPDPGSPRRLRALRITTRLLTGDTSRCQRWLDALTAQGFREIHRDDYKHYPQAVLQRGHLLLVVDAPAPASTAAAAAKVAHQRRAEDAFAEAEA